MISALMMFRRFERALRYALHEENFAAILGAAATLVVVGTLAYTLDEDRERKWPSSGNQALTKRSSAQWP